MRTGNGPPGAVSALRGSRARAQARREALSSSRGTAARGGRPPPLRRRQDQRRGHRTVRRGSFRGVHGLLEEPRGGRGPTPSSRPSNCVVSTWLSIEASTVLITCRSLACTSPTPCWRADTSAESLFSSPKTSANWRRISASPLGMAAERAGRSATAAAIRDDVDPRGRGPRDSRRLLLRPGRPGGGGDRAGAYLPGPGPALELAGTRRQSWGAMPGCSCPCSNSGSRHH